MGAKVWSNVTVKVDSSLSAKQAVTAITKASPPVLTYAGADTFANGDYALLVDIAGMNEVANRIFRVANVNTAANTLELEGQNSTSFGTFTAGNIQQITFGTTLSNATDVNASGGDFDFIDTTPISSPIKTQIPGAANTIKYDFTAQWDPADAAQAALVAASLIKAQKCVHVAFADGSRILFYGYAAAIGVPGGSAQQLVTTPISLVGTGYPTMYAT